MFFVFAYAYTAFVIIGQSASSSLLRTKGITISLYKLLTQRMTSPYRVIPYGATVRYPSPDSSKETPAWNEAIALGPVKSRLMPGLASSAAVHDREIYLQDIHSGASLVQGTLLLDMIELKHKLTARLDQHARDTSPQSVLAQQIVLLLHDLPVTSPAPSDIPTMSSASSVLPTTAPDTPDRPTPTFVPSPSRARRSPCFQVAPPSNTDPDPDPPSMYVSEVRAVTSDLQHSPNVKFDRVDQALRSQGYCIDRSDTDPSTKHVLFSDSAASESIGPHTEPASLAPAEINPFNEFEDTKDSAFESVSEAFWTDFDPKSDMHLQLDNIDLEHVQRIHLQFDPFRK